MLILPEFPPAIGGMQTHAVYLTQHLQRQGHDVCVYTYQGATPFKMDAARQFDDALTFPVHRVMSRIGYWHSVGLLVDAARVYRPDLIYSSTTFYGLLDKLCDVPVICRSVGNDVMRPWIAYPFRFASKMLSSWRLEEPLYDFFRKLETPELVETIFPRSSSRRRPAVRATACRSWWGAWRRTASGTCGRTGARSSGTASASRGTGSCSAPSAGWWTRRAWTF
jgi:phosphatidylinositol alpha-1,6-mannosyltransferase